VSAIVGYTGFVGGNLCAEHGFDSLYNSRNVESAFGTHPDLLVYCGVPAEMFLANTDPAADAAVCEAAAANVRAIGPKRLVLVSSVAVLDDVNGTDEDYVVDPEGLTAYGLHRYQLEQAVKEIVRDCHIVRLPALFGKGLRKNFIYDLINFFPPVLNRTKYEEFSATEPVIGRAYVLGDSGFYRLTKPSVELRSAFERLDFSALKFTDSRSVFQFYNLAYLWAHLQMVIAHDIPLLHCAVEPISSADIHREVTGRVFVNEVSARPFNYDMRTKHSELFGGTGGYIFNRGQVALDLKAFVKENSR
jgi:hypothetical protein